MKTLTVFMLFLFPALLLHGQKQVKSMTLTMNGKLTEKVFYTENGAISSRETLLSEDPAVWFKEIYQFSNNLPIRSEHFVNGMNIAGYEFFYNEKNQMERRREKQNDSVTGVTYFVYGDNGMLESETNYMGKYKKILTSYGYNAAGLVTSRTESITEPDADMVLSEQYFYNKNGQMELAIGMNGADTVSDIRYQWDQLGRRITQFVLNHGDTSLAVEWEYRGNSARPCIERHKANGFVVRQTKTKYNSAGLKKRERIVEFRVFSGNMKPEKMKKIYKYTWYPASENNDGK